MRASVSPSRDDVEDSYRALPVPQTLPTRHAANHALQSFVASPVGFFSDRKPMWWAWWGLRAAGLVGVLIAFILLLKNFYDWRSTCKWCKYLSCLVSRLPFFL